MALRTRPRALKAFLALLSVGAVTGAVIVVTSLGEEGTIVAAPAADTSRCTTAAFPGETETVAPSPSPSASPAPTPSQPSGPLPGGWSGVWSTAVQDLNGPDLTGKTLRQIVLPTAGGTGLRLRLANTFGTEPLRFSRVTVAAAVASGSPGLRPGSVQLVTFGGTEGVEIPPGGRVASDPVELLLPFGRPLAVDLVPEGPVTAGTGHSRAYATSFLADGDRAGQSAGTAFTATVRSWFWLEGVDVPDPVGDGSISMFGDSITEGMASTPDSNQRWPDLLSARMRQDAATAGLGVLNEGIAGNRITMENLSCGFPSASGLRRFEYDVLSRPDVRTVVIALGINDIAAGRPATIVVDGLTVLSERAREHGLRVLGATLTPFSCDDGCLSPEKEQQRQLVNDWIRTAPEFDAVVDFDAALRDPATPERLLAPYDSGDQLHPSDAGMRAMAAAFDLNSLVWGR